MLDGVEAEAVHPGGIEVPLAPAVELPPHVGVADVDVAAHEVIEIAFL